MEDWPRSRVPEEADRGYPIRVGGSHRRCFTLRCQTLSLWVTPMGTGDIYTGTCGEQHQNGFLSLFACPGSLIRLLAAAATAASRQTGVYIAVLE